MKAHSLRSLEEEYQKNPLRFEKEHKGESLTVEGVVENIAQDFSRAWDSPEGFAVDLYIEDEVGNNEHDEYGTIKCIFEKNNENAILELNIGERITVKGILKSATYKLYDCKIVCP